MDTEIVRAWVEGWAASRRAAPVVEEPWGFTVDVGLPGQVTRHVLPNADETLIRGLMETTTAPGTWLKVLTEPQTISPWLTPAWTFDDPGFLMSATLHPSATRLPAGYQLRTWSRGEVTRALVRDKDGAFAAHGQVAATCHAGSVVFDQIETAPAHRRQGLGRAVMHTLANAAIAAGARTGVLAATVEGQGLYESLGWTTHAPLTSVVLTSSDAGR
ncbi:GNAT family N-acetyltransferase [Streptomyces sp. AS02]|uniref:GNAT family N-acetyltransferase n=1 Tax=Streptomyces sp. AS02 TaxID=2938946 RepID=UPI0020222A9E|nr:GNAT family N-acetyltransferase [Streptomyces sp. AS02]MCL8017982.1 GNAT family N-acetyltransferase [Streptomyces sp. AS02]